MWTISLPLRIRVTKKKERYFQLNLNQYRNTNPFTLDKAKKQFDELVQPLIRAQKIPSLLRCALEYTLYPGTRQLCDVNNVCSIVDKFFSDSLVAASVIPDDNYNFIADSRFKFGHVDKENPRVEVVIRSPDHIPLVPPEPLQDTQETPTMKIQTVTTIHLSQEDVTQALKDYLARHANLGSEAEHDIRIDRQEDGTYELRLAQQSAPVVQVPPSGGVRKKKIEPKEAIAAVNEELERKHSEEPSPALVDVPVSEPVQLEQPEQSQQQVETSAEASSEELVVPPKKKGLFGDFVRPSN
jgi:hypothetical protein